MIPGRKNRKIPIEYDKKIYALRKRIEMFFGAVQNGRYEERKNDSFKEVYFVR